MVDDLVKRISEIILGSSNARFLTNVERSQFNEFQLSDVLVMAGGSVFRSYESQYVKMISEVELPNALSAEVLAGVAVSRAIGYIKDQKTGATDDHVALSELIAKGVVLYSSLKGKFRTGVYKAARPLCVVLRGSTPGTQKDYTYLQLEDMYSKAGLVQIENSGNVYYERVDGSSDTRKYGYRLPFEWELRDRLNGWQQAERTTEVQYEYVFQSGEVERKNGIVLGKLDEKKQIKKSDLKVILSCIEEIGDKLDKLCSSLPYSLTVNPIEEIPRDLVIPKDDEAVQKYFLEVTDGEDKDIIQELKRKLFVVEALRLVNAYISQEKEKLKRRGGSGSSVSDYLKKLQESLNDLELQCKEDLEVKMVNVVYSMTLEKIKEHVDLWVKASQLIEIAAYLGSQGVDVKGVFGQLELWSSFELMHKFSLIRLEAGQLIIGKLVREVITVKLKQEKKEEGVLKRIVEKIDITCRNGAIALSIWKWYAKEYDELRGNLLDRFKGFKNQERDDLLRILICHDQSEVAERILRDVDDDIRKEIIDTTGSDTSDSFLQFVAKNNAIGIVKYLVDEQGIINFREKNNFTSLFLENALFGGALDVLKYLIGENNVDLFNHVDASSCVIIAASSGKIDLVKYLVEEKGLANAKDVFCAYNNLLYLIAHCPLSMVKYFIEGNLSCITQSRTIMNLAVYFNRLDVMECLFNCKRSDRGGASFSVNDIIGLVFLAASHNSVDVLKYLVEGGYIGINKNLSEANILLSCAVLSGSIGVVVYLIEDRKMVDLKDGEQVSYLLSSCIRGVCTEKLLCTLKYLVDKRIDCCEEGEEHACRHLIEFSVSYDVLIIVKYLIEGKNKAALAEEIGADLLFKAVEWDSRNVLEYLIEKRKMLDSAEDCDCASLMEHAIEADSVNSAEYLIMKFPSLAVNMKGLLNRCIEEKSEGLLTRFITDDMVFALYDPVSSMDLLKLAVQYDLVEVVKCLLEDRRVVDLERNPGDLQVLIKLASESSSSITQQYFHYYAILVSNPSDGVEKRDRPTSSLSSVTVDQEVAVVHDQL